MKEIYFAVVLHYLLKYKVNFKVWDIVRAQKCSNVFQSYITARINIKEAKSVQQMAHHALGLGHYLLLDLLAKVRGNEFLIPDPIITIKIDRIESFPYRLFVFNVFKIFLKFFEVYKPIFAVVYFQKTFSQIFKLWIWDLICKIDHNHFNKKRPIIELPHFFKYLFHICFG